MLASWPLSIDSSVEKSYKVSPEIPDSATAYRNLAIKVAEPRETTDDQPSRGLATRLASLRAWTVATRTRSTIAALSLAVAVGLTVGSWLYVASLAAPTRLLDWHEAVAAFNDGELEEAESLAHELQTSGMGDGPSIAASLFVLGGIRAHEAAQQWSDERRWVEYRVAANYLQKAIEIGVPEEIEEQALVLAGRSLLESHRAAAAIEVLRQALENNESSEIEVHRLLAESLNKLPIPDYRKSIEHTAKLLELVKPTDPDYSPAVLAHVDNLGRLGRIAEARRFLATVSGPVDEVNYLAAKLDLSEGQSLGALAELNGDSDGRSHANALLDSAITKFASLPRTSRRWQTAQLLVAEGLAHAGKIDVAIAQLVELRQSHGAGWIATIASLDEGELLLRKGNYSRAVNALRRGLSTMGDTRMYWNSEVSLSELRRRYMAMVEELQFRHEYALAESLSKDLGRLLGKTQHLELLAHLQQEWGEFLVAQAERETLQRRDLERLGREKLRAAGGHYEQLAQRRFATPSYIDNLWQSCEAYFSGQSYSSAIRALGDYLRYEPEKRNAQALLRLGQSLLARGDIKRGIASLEECIELHPDDAATYQARLDCAAGYRNYGDYDLAEELLLANLSGSLQSPRSPEWRDSLFELGHLLHDTGRYTEAIDRLEEAIDRYPDDRKTRLANYLVADSYRKAADAPLELLKAAKTENERETATREASRLLSEAIGRYENVQRDIALSTDPDSLDKAMLRNCYMMRADALFDLGRYDEASKAYSNLSTLYQRDPFVLETLIQIANCQRRLNEPKKAQLTIAQARLALDRLSSDADFASTTNFNREQWRLMLEDMSKWDRE